MQLFGQNEGKGPFNIRQDQLGEVLSSGIASLARFGTGAFVSGYRAEIDTEYKNPTADLPIKEYSEVRLYLCLATKLSFAWCVWYTLMLFVCALHEYDTSQERTQNKVLVSCVCATRLTHMLSVGFFVCRM